MIDIIIPVYKGFEDTKRCLESVRSCLDEHLAHVVIVDDASPDPLIQIYLDSIIKEDHRITLIRNPANQGFIKSVNCGMALHPNRDVILLNSDTVVAGDWILRLHHSAYRKAETGTVTPFSNNATILSFPDYLKENPLIDGLSIEALDHIFKKANGGMDLDIPTAVGFCMYIKRSCLQDTGYFDELHFGIGYGEENDFCMRAMRKGWRHQLCADTFIYHKGGVSFDSLKEKRIENALAIIDRLHPDYHRMIRDHIAQDPERPFRVNAMLHLIRHSPKKKILFINHNLGGGTEKHIRDLSSLLKNRLWPIILFPSTNGRIILQPGPDRVQESLSFSLPEDYEALFSVLRFLNVSRIHIHQILGIPKSVFTLSIDLSIPYEITLHDHYLINGNPTLIDKNACFCEEKERRDERCGAAYPIPEGLSPEAWRKKQKKLLKGARRVFSPSCFTAAIFRDYFPDLKMVVSFHPDWEKEAPYPTPEAPPFFPNEPFRILVLGALSREKGADTVEDCARLASKDKTLFEFHLAGYAYRKLHPAVIQHGAYKNADLPGIIQSINPHLIWFPAICPETYSYTLSASLKVARPIAAPNIGAFPERLKNRPLTWIVAWQTPSFEWMDRFHAIRRALIGTASSAKATFEWMDQPRSPDEGFRYSTHYLEDHDEEAPENTVKTIPIDLIKRHLSVTQTDGGEPPAVSVKGKLLILLLKLRNHPVSGWLINKIPYRIQQTVKRKIAPVGDPLSSVIVREQVNQTVKK